MRVAAGIAAVLVAHVALGHFFMRIPEERLEISKLSEVILLVKVENVVREPPTRDEAVEMQNFSVRGKIVEVIRGAPRKLEFVHEGIHFRIIDRKQMRRKHEELQKAGVFEDPSQGEGLQCEKGKHYVVLYCEGQPYFREADINDQGWRKLIVPNIFHEKARKMDNESKQD